MFDSDSKVSLSKATKQTFKKVGTKYIGQSGTLTLHQRKEFTERKPKLYLIFKPSGEAKPQYLTGLYPQPNGGFIGESKGVYWVIDLTEAEISFQPLNQNPL